MRTRRLKSSSDPVPREHGNPKGELEAGHRTVLLHEAIEQLAIQPSDVIVDATLGGGGHARSIAKLLGKKGVLIGIDADEAAVLRAGEALKDIVTPEIHLVVANFRDISRELGKLGVTSVDKHQFDLE